MIERQGSRPTHRGVRRAGLLVLATATILTCALCGPFLWDHVLHETIGYAWTDGPGPRFGPHYKVLRKRVPFLPGPEHTLDAVHESHYWTFERQLHWVLRFRPDGQAEMIQNGGGPGPSRAVVQVPG